ncbi:MAG: hypothetical protein ACRDR6_26095 [Pseudonocardiaceae bacterium]
MAENMSIIAEVWPVVADEHGIWLVSGGDAWRSYAVPADSEPHFEVELVLASYDAGRPVLLHSTSWRTDGPRIVLTYMAVLDCPSLARDRWAAALPVSAELLPAVGNPPPHGAAEAPVPRYIDVLYHGLRHLRFLIDTDASARESLAGNWTAHLGRLSPVLAGMYD